MQVNVATLNHPKWREDPWDYPESKSASQCSCMPCSHFHHWWINEMQNHSLKHLFNVQEHWPITKCCGFRQLLFLYSACYKSPRKYTYKHSHTRRRVKYQKASRKMRGETGDFVRQTRVKRSIRLCLLVKLRTQLEIINKLQCLCLAMHILCARCALQFLCFTKLWSAVIKMGKYIFVGVYFSIANHLTK